MSIKDFILPIKIFETNVALAASATFISPTKTMYVGNTHLTVFVFANVAGTLNIEVSDGAAWRVPVGYSQAIAANETRIITQIIPVLFYRLRYVNGASAQTTFALHSMEFKL